jgi:O-antigen ligase
MTSSSLTYPLDAARAERNSSIRIVAVVCGIAVFTFAALGVIFANLVSWDLFIFLLAAAIFLGLLFLARPLSKSTLVSGKQAFLSASLVIWLFLMTSEGIFIHSGSTAGASGGHFDPTAYYEALSWILSVAALAFITAFRPAYLLRLFSGPMKWPAIFAIIAVLSCPLSPSPAYSLAMAFKLCVIVLTLNAIAESVEEQTDVAKLFSIMLAGMLVVTVATFLTPFLAPGPAFVNGRLVIIGISGLSGIVLLLSTLFFLLKKNPWFLALGTFAITAMMLAGSKGGTASSLLSFMMFFILLKRARQALAVCIGFIIVFGLFVAFTPLGDSLENYSRAGAGSTLSGRTNLWGVVWPEIVHHPIFGHGYRASRFVSQEVEGAFAEAGHTHNSFLEVLYNNGLVGAIPILIMNWLIVTNLTFVLKRAPNLQMRYYAALAFALYIQLLVWGMFSPTFGGMPDSRFMTFFSVLIISSFLRSRISEETSNPIRV